MKIFIVDDDATLRMLIKDKFESPQWQITEFESGEQLLAAIDERPDLILLDIEMGGIDGLLTCQSWRQNERQVTTIIFVSSNDDLKTRLTAYDVGANDFISKPISFPELEKKIKLTEQWLQQQQAINEHVRFVEQTAMAALSSLGEMGVIRQFMQAAFGARTIDNLIFATMEALRQFSLTGLIKIGTGSETRYFSSQSQSCNALEMSLLDQAHLAGHIVCIDNRLIINFPTITLFAQDSTNTDDSLLQKLRDSLTILAEACHAWLLSFASNQETLDSDDPIIAPLLDAINNIESTLNINRYRIEEIHKQLLTKQLVTLEFTQLNEVEKAGLTEDIKKIHQQLASFLESEKKMTSELSKVAERLQATINKPRPTPPPVLFESE